MELADSRLKGHLPSVKQPGGEPYSGLRRILLSLCAARVFLVDAKSLYLKC